MLPPEPDIGGVRRGGMGGMGVFPFLNSLKIALLWILDGSRSSYNCYSNTMQFTHTKGNCCIMNLDPNVFTLQSTRPFALNFS